MSPETAIVSWISSITWEAVASLSAVGAAMFAAWSAWASHISAKEARLARKRESAPKLVLERRLSTKRMTWPNPDPDKSDLVPRWESTKVKDADPAGKDFSLINYGGPALAVELIFGFDDEENDLSVPEYARSLGLSVDERNDPMKKIKYKDHTGPLYHRYRVRFPSCVPNQPREFDFPGAMSNRLFL